jgi:glycosyltransferase involved in cell wall biosynthesis
MKILHVVPHCGGGVGSVLMGWMSKVGNNHSIVSLDYVNEKAARTIKQEISRSDWRLGLQIKAADIVLCHYWDHPMLADLFADPIPDCRLVFWCHKNITYSPEELAYPDLWIDTSPIQGHGRYIWSTGGVERFLEIQPKPHKGFNVGYVGTVDYKKIHKSFLPMCTAIKDSIGWENVHFTIIGEQNLFHPEENFACSDGLWPGFTFTSKVDDVAPYLAEMDVFGYPLRPDNYGTSEQVLGESMASGVVPVVMANPCEMQIVKHGGNGFVATTEADYVAHIQYLYNHPSRRREMADTARVDAKELYSIDTMISKWNDVFEELMSQPKRSRKELR